MSQIPATHRALVINADHSDWEVKQQPLPAYDDLLVKVHAVALNPTDWKHRHYKQIPPGSSTGSDFAGVVVAAKGSTQYKVGDRVAGFTRGGFLQRDNGAFAEYIAAQTPIVWAIPDGTTFAQAVAIGGIPADTAAQALYTRLDIPRPWDPARLTAVKAGDPILIWSGASSVAHYAIQLAKLAGLKVYTTASPHHTHLQALGADVVLDYTGTGAQGSAGEQIHALSDGKITVALDAFSHAESIELVAQALSAQGGTIISILGGWKADDFAAKHPNVEVVSNAVYDVLEDKNAVDRADIAEWHKVLPGLLESKQVRSHNIDLQQGGLEAVPAGLLRLMEGKVSGQRIVYTISE